MLRLGIFFTIKPLERPGDSAAVYVPLVMVSRGLAFVRTLLVARIVETVSFGAYQPALELINLLVAFVLLGAADVTERYISRVEHTLGPLGARRWLMRLALRVGATAFGGVVILEILSPWVSTAMWGRDALWPALLPMCGVTVICLALYQQLAAALRGLGAFGAAAGMEGLGAVLLLFLSTLAAFTQSPAWLIAAYGASVVIPYALYATILWRFMSRRGATLAAEATSSTAPDSPSVILAYGREDPVATYRQFAFWSLARLILVMAFGFLAIWGVRFRGGDVGGLTDAADFSVCYRIAQILGFLAVTMWASVYGIAARASSHGRTGRARVQFFRVGRLGMAGLMIVTMLLLLGKGYLARALPDYDRAIDEMLPALLGMFLWYALVAFSSNYADLREKPQHGAAIWGAAVFVQMILIAWPNKYLFSLIDAWYLSTGEYVLAASALGLVAAIVVGMVFALAGTRWPFRFTRISTPLIILGIAPAALFSPTSIVDYVAPVFLTAVLAFLLLTGQLIRPMDRRAIRRWWGRKRNHALRGNARPT